MGGDWNRDDVFLFVRNPASPVARTSADGRAPVDVTKLEAGHAGHAFPHFLPDGRHFLYYVVAGPEARGIYAGQVDGTPPKRLLDADGGAVYTKDRKSVV